MSSASTYIIKSCAYSLNFSYDTQTLYRFKKVFQSGGWGSTAFRGAINENYFYQFNYTHVVSENYFYQFINTHEMTYTKKKNISH